MNKQSEEKETRWQTSDIERHKKLIKDELTEYGNDKSKRELLRHISEHIDALEKDNSLEGQLRRFIYLMQALFHHARFGGLRQKQLKYFTELGYNILKLQNILPLSSQRSFLYSDLHMVLGQIHRKEGRPWDAAWEQQLSHLFCKNSAQDNEGIQNLTVGNRELRLGNIAQALEKYDLAEQHGLSSSSQEQAQLARIRALRLSGNLEQADKISNLIEKNLPQYSANGKLEWEWEGLCRKVVNSGNLDLMLKAVKPGKPHRLAVYLVDAFFWSKCFKKTSWTYKLPAIDSLLQYNNLKPRRLGFYLAAAQGIENCYDKEIPIFLRLKELGRMLSNIKKLLSIEQELLAWLAAARLLTRLKNTSLAALALNEYRALSLRLSNGSSDDILKLAEDLLKKDWVVKS